MRGCNLVYPYSGILFGKKKKKRNEVIIDDTTSVNLDRIMLSKTSVAKDYMLYYDIQVKCPE